MRKLWAPWRIKYVENATDEPGRCIFCKPEDSMLIAKEECAVVLLNRFPYNPGHLLIAPASHVGSVEEVPETERRALWGCLERAILALKAEMKPHGFNVGMNIGRSAGAGIPDHIHLHVVPRWDGDTNFFPVVADDKVIPEGLADTRARLLQYFNAP